jgi:hypothetical protein
MSDTKEHERTVEDISMDTGTVTNAMNQGKTNDDIDDAILRINGHDAVLERQFNWLSALGLGFSITNSWIGYLVSVALDQMKGTDSLIPPYLEQFRSESHLWRTEQCHLWSHCSLLHSIYYHSRIE